MHLCQRLFQSSKHFSNSIFGMAFSSFSDTLLMSSMAVKRWPFKVLLIFGNRKKSHGAMSGEYGGWGIVSDSWARSSTQVWALCSETHALREADISWFRHVASEKRACSLVMRCVTLAARDSCAIFVSFAHRPVPPQRRGLWWTKWEKTASLRACDVLWY